MPIINNEEANTAWQRKNESAINILRVLITNQVRSIEIKKESTIVHLIDGRKFYWEENLYYSLATLLTDGEWEPEDTNILKNLISKDNTVLDIGANFGWYTSIFSKLVGTHGQVHSFEPFLGTFYELMANTSLNELSNIRLNNLAVSDFNGISTLYYPTGSGSMLSSLQKIPDVTEEFIPFECTVTTLDEYVKSQEIKQVDFIKIDAEGAELPILRGATSILDQRNKPTLLIECVEKFANSFGYQLKDVHEFLENYDYQFFVWHINTYIEVNSFDHLPTYNVFCIHTSNTSVTNFLATEN
ncbi:FkbM family methyltransferase [Bacillus mycoides]|uniref:FkbM family methyltransferase n=1 Tax=Bacillus mycoides TaxID=1405 RepID=UPI003D1F1CEA